MPKVYPTNQYILIGDVVYFSTGHTQPRPVSNQIAILYDSQNSTVLKHGPSDAVHSAAEKMRSQIKGNMPGWANALIVVEFDILEVGLDWVNKVINTSGIINQMIREYVAKNGGTTGGREWWG